MPCFARAAFLLTCFLAPWQSAGAGVYTTTEREPFPVVTAQDKVKSAVGTLTMLNDVVAKAANNTSSERAELIKQVETNLEPKRTKGELTLHDRVTLAAGYFRLGRFAKAIPVLNEVLDEGSGQVKDDAPERFLLLANLASAYQGTGDLRGAIRTQKQALAAAPTKAPVAAWGQDQWEHYLIAERYYLILLELRHEAVERRPVAKGLPLDALFPKVRFVGTDGKYEAGRIAPESLHELPRDALAIVVQLLHWQPTDARLMWLYGELLNADGRINEAYRTLNDLLFTGSFESEDLKKHRQILRGSLVPEKNEEVELPPEKSSPEEPKKPDEKPGKGMPDWRTLGTGFAAGLLVSVFGFMQLYLWSRRRRTPVVPVHETLPRGSP